ncbi:alpha/beta hydrolase [Nocardiopsis terrae]|uniref:Pimeloyl-ACP methyl ester carboxylesterase n=1 Tax=Nocardiopsis terrae TaxID=372655 RepID=A0ABR9HEJ6_9ACTN|nr:alpha/beta fold hydrolase [Nocardiopsis terrae]MBE1457453.1 pimeloyl-ACP methyl ester carboxylesterase [Nocardiopsis terrae]GHC92257.1 alpha/beta hydrolase [Nocardiopsis terrae]
MHHLQRPEGRIAYDLYGAEHTGTTVICVPGMFDHRSSFRFVGAALAAAGHSVAVMDLRGHGDSDTAFDDHTDHAAATDAIALAEELGGGPTVMVGNSLGAGAVTIAAFERPDMVAGITLLAPFLRPPRSTRATRALQRVLLTRPWAPRALALFYGRLHAGRTPEGHREQLERIRRMLRPADRYRAVLATVNGPKRAVEWIEGSEHPNAEAVVVMGERDPDWKDPRAEARWAASVVGGRLVMVPDCGHYPQSQRPDVVVPVITELIERVNAGA